MVINKDYVEKENADCKTKHRNTIQRVKILKFLKNSKNHPNAETIYKAVSKDIPTITLATVYRNLKILKERGEIIILEINKEYRYDASTGSHIHCICKNCGKIIDVMDDKIINYAMKNLKAKDFIPKETKIMFKGICKECADKN